MWLQGKIAIGEKVTVRGWVRTRRDSKAGLSFLAVYDGSCFDPIQAIVNNDIENYDSEVLRLTTGCSVIVTGTIVESPAEGQAVELQAEKVEVTGFVEDPDTYPMAAKRHSIEYLREVAHFTSSYQYYRCSRTCSSLLGASYSFASSMNKVSIGWLPH